MFVTFPYSDNTVTLNVAHITYVVWSRPVQGAAVPVSVSLVGGTPLNLNLTPSQIQQLESSLAEYNRRHGV